MARRVLALLLLPILSGCGTMSNMQGTSRPLMGLPDRETRVFGGVANDVRWVGEAAKRAVSPEEVWDVPICLSCAAYFGLVDLPLSLAGDIITMPKVIRKRHWPAPETADTPD